MNIKLSTCPACASKKIHRKTGSVKDYQNGKMVTIPRATFWECSSCREQFFDVNDLTRIQDISRKKQIAI